MMTGVLRFGVAGVTDSSFLRNLGVVNAAHENDRSSADPAARSSARNAATALHRQACALDWLGLHTDDGNHALYHREMRETRWRDWDRTADRGQLRRRCSTGPPPTSSSAAQPRRLLQFGMLLPLLCNRARTALSRRASPIVRGLSDDKHLTKLEAAARAFRPPHGRCSGVERRSTSPLSASAALVIKPNNSSASWGVRDAHDRIELGRSIAEIHALDHDALVEPFIDGSDIEGARDHVGRRSPRCCR